MSNFENEELSRREFLDESRKWALRLGAVALIHPSSSKSVEENKEKDPNRIEYGFTVGNTAARLQASQSKRPFGYYHPDVLLRYKYISNDWAEVIQDSYQTHPDWTFAREGIYVPTDQLNILTSQDIAPIPLVDPSEQRHIEVNLTKLYMRAISNGQIVNEVPVSTGKKGDETPPGTFQIFNKRFSRHMQGEDGNLPWDLPGVPFVQYITNDGIAIHGAYWHAKFGHDRVSHGCINARIPDALWFYRWTMPVHENIAQEDVNGDRNSTVVVIKR